MILSMSVSGVRLASGLSHGFSRERLFGFSEGYGRFAVPTPSEDTERRHRAKTPSSALFKPAEGCRCCRFGGDQVQANFQTKNTSQDPPSKIKGHAHPKYPRCVEFCVSPFCSFGSCQRFLPARDPNRLFAFAPSRPQVDQPFLGAVSWTTVQQPCDFGRSMTSYDFSCLKRASSKHRKAHGKSTSSVCLRFRGFSLAKRHVGAWAFAA